MKVDEAVEINGEINKEVFIAHGIAPEALEDFKDDMVEVELVEEICVYDIKAIR